jgi:tetratricopeptide (TPR) repeat protein
VSRTTGTDFFISYTGADTAWAEWVADSLEEAGYTTILQAWDFRPGENFIQRMDQALANADRVVAVLSPAYFASEYTRDEWVAALVRGSGERDRLLPVRIAPVQLPGLLATRIYIDLVGLDEQAARERLLAGVAPGPSRAKPARRPPFPRPEGTPGEARIRFPGQPPAVFNVPARNLSFTGRIELLDTLRRHLSQDAARTVLSPAALYGLGGAGKTQLVLEYAHRYASDYDLIWWTPSEQPVAIASHLAALARRLNIPEAADLNETAAAVLDELRQRDRWLLIFDDAEDASDLHPYLPGGGGHVLITSRNPSWGSLGTTVQVEVLSREESVAFLVQRTRMDQAAATALAEALGDLPLALEQAAAYLEETGTSPEEYCTLLQERALELLALGRPFGSDHTTATAWTISLDRVEDRSPVSRDLLSLCAFLGPDYLPRTLLTDHPDVLPESLGIAVRDVLSFHEALGALRRYSLAMVTKEALGMHRLVQTVVRHSLTRDQQQLWAEAAVRLVLAAFPAEPADPDRWLAADPLLSHGLAATNHAQALNAASEATASLLNHAANYMWGRVKYSEARILLERALAIHEAQVGPDHPSTARSLNNLAAVLHSQGDLHSAYTLLDRTLHINLDALGADHQDYAATLNNLAAVLQDQGDLDGARTHLERALAIRKAQLGPDHPSTARSLNNLAAVLQDQGDLDGARTLLERALNVNVNSLGPGHPRTVRSRKDLAAVRSALET